ncbi:hypothetical protein CDD82_3759 [Ophiocordyceps australis]|uniref:Major facilitator superfamily (MFS) profile domain-containing protein n=1 Tax=Ophiocordyceps australis TaxID=1399860 RepID=A0A2C5Z7C5_9HYPO|nr:hypothetical protein CDD82_3759 [Ophiocordyceps australis]
MAKPIVLSRRPAAFPVQQMFILACCRICEPIAFMSIFPYIYYMIEDFGVTSDPSTISVYAGMVTSAFTLAEFSTGMLWGRLSDRIGRKPVLLTGLFGTALSVLVFGFSQSLPVALLARALGGLLNGNIGVLQTTVAELVTMREQQPRAYTIMPMVWCIGSIVGPMIGGALARPCISYPQLFPPGSVWARFPYLLPNLFSAAAVLVGLVVGLLFLDETHATAKLRRDRGRELGRHLASWLGASSVRVSCTAGNEKHQVLMSDSTSSSHYGACSSLPRTPAVDHEESLPSYQSRQTSPQLLPQKQPPVMTQAPVTDNSHIFTKPVVMNIVSYGILAFHTMTFDQLLPVFLSTAPPKQPVMELPFKFVDGFGLETKTIGFIMSVQGIYSLLSNFAIVPPVTRRLGSLRLFRLVAVSYFALYLTTPYLVLLPTALRMPSICLLVVWKCTYSTMAYPNNAILLANAAPSRQVLGTINGVAASTASLCRALGPTLSGVLYAVGLRTGYSGLAWWASGLITLVGAYLSFQITEGDAPGTQLERRDATQDLDESLLYSDEEAV